MDRPKQIEEPQQKRIRGGKKEETRKENKKKRDANYFLFHMHGWIDWRGRAPSCMTKGYETIYLRLLFRLRSV